MPFTSADRWTNEKKMYICGIHMCVCVCVRASSTYTLISSYLHIQPHDVWTYLSEMCTNHCVSLRQDSRYYAHMIMYDLYACRFKYVHIYIIIHLCLHICTTPYHDYTSIVVHWIALVQWHWASDSVGCLDWQSTVQFTGQSTYRLPVAL